MLCEGLRRGLPEFKFLCIAIFKTFSDVCTAVLKPILELRPSGALGQKSNILMGRQTSLSTLLPSFKVKL